MADQYEYRIIDDGARVKAERKVNQAVSEGWELVTFTTGGGSLGWRFVFLLRRRKDHP